MAELLSLVLTLEATNSAVIPPAHGPAVQAIFLSLIGSLDTMLSASLHRGSGLRPYTISPLAGELQRTSAGLQVSRGQRCSLRFASLTRAVSECMEGLQAQTDTAFHLYSAEFRIVSACFDYLKDPDAHQIDYQDLQEAVRRKHRAHPAVRLGFLTPTSFKDGTSQDGRARNISLPIPAMVFQSLSRKWEAFAPRQDKGELSKPSNASSPSLFQEVSRAVILGPFNLQGHEEEFASSEQSGFTGVCEFRLPSHAPDSWRYVLHLLAEYSFFAGVGRETAWGRGQTRPLALEK